MRSKIRYLITRYWLVVFFILLFVVISVYQISFEKIWQNISSLSLWQLTVLTFVYFQISLLSILLRKYLLFVLHIRSSFKNLFYIHFSTMAAHYSTPAKIGYPLTVFLLKRIENVPYTFGTALILIELTVNMLISGFFALTGSFLFFKNYLHNIAQVFLILLLGVFSVTVAVNLLKKRKQKTKISKLIGDIINSFSSISLKNIFIYVLMAGIVQMFSATNLILLAYFFSDGLSFFQAVAASSAAFFLGAVSMIPMGLGVRDVTMLFMLNQFGIGTAAGVSIVTIQRLLSTGLTIVLGGILGGVLGVKNIVSEKRFLDSHS